MELSKALGIIQDNNLSTSGIEDWVQEFIEDLIENMEDLSVYNFITVQAMEKALGILDKEIDDGYIENEHQVELAYFKKSIKENGRESVMKTLKKAKKLEKFFIEWY